MSKIRCLARLFAVYSLVLTLISVANAGEQQLSIHDYTGRGFAPDLVQYQVDGMDIKKSTSLRLYDMSGKSLPVQWTADPSGKGGLVGFVASVAHDESISFRLNDAANGAVAAGQLSVTTAKDKTVLANGLFSVTLPGAVDKIFDAPVKADTLQAPILAFASGGSGAMGTSKMATSRLVKRMRVSLAAQGPVFADALYELTWAEGGYYRCRVRVVDGVPMAQVMEEYDSGKLDGSDFWELSLTQGWQPDQVEHCSPWGNGTDLVPGTIGSVADFIKQPLKRMSVDTMNLGHVGFFRKDQRESNANGYPMAGVVVLRKGEWRRVNVIEVQCTSPGDVRFRFPMSARDAAWPRDNASASSPFCSLSLDPSVPATYGRRHWGLMLSQVRLPKEEGAVAFTEPAYKGVAQEMYNRMTPFARARSLYGIVTLDQYKNYILEWPDTGVKYPRLSKAGDSPLPGDRAQQLKKLYEAYLSWIPSYYLNNPTPSHHATCENYIGALAADSLLKGNDLTADQRKDIRARLALILYLHHEPGVLSFGIGSHPGNPNMPLARFFPGVAYLGLLPDHPMAATWTEFMDRQSDYELGKIMAPGGAWLEYGTYHFHGFRALPMLASLSLMKSANVDRIFDYVHADLEYIMNLLSAPDPRYRARIIPGLANSGPNTTARLVEGANAFHEKDPEFAARLLGAWKENNSQPGTLPAPAGIQPKQLELTSKYFPGFGVVFRAHQGPQETWMMLRNGFLWSHWNIDPGHFAMSSRGAVLVPSQPFQYGASTDNTFDLCNTVRFGAPENQMPYGAPDSNVLDYYFGSSVDYAWSSAGVPDWFIKPGAASPFEAEFKRTLAPELKQQEGAFQWDRQVMFLKGKSAASPNYFVFRDSTRGDGKLASYLNMNLLGRKADLKVEGMRIAADTEWPVKLEVLFGESPATPALLEQNEAFQLYEANTPASLPKGETPSRNWVNDKGVPWKTGEGLPAAEQHVLLRIPAAPDQGYFYVLYPRDASEAAPIVKKLADGVMSITHREGTDYVLLSSLPVKYESGDVLLEGCAAAVRVSASEVSLTLAAGNGRVGFKGKVLAGNGPFEKRFPLAAMAAGVEKQPVQVSSKVLMPAFDAGEEVATGLRKKTEAGATHYRVQGEGLVHTKVGNVRVEARNASIQVAESSVRFIVPDREYVRLTVAGTGVRGMGPFDLTFTPTGITGTVDGTMRTLVTTWPEKITRPMYHQDGRQWYAGWSDDPCISKTIDRPQFGIAFGVQEGGHAVEIAEWKYPPMPPIPPTVKAGF